jgi:hypothetical protein
MWAYGHHFRGESVNYWKQTCDCRVSFASDQTNCPSSRDTNAIEGQIDYVGSIQEIIELGYLSFLCVILN